MCSGGCDWGGETWVEGRVEMGGGEGGRGARGRWLRGSGSGGGETWVEGRVEIGRGRSGGDWEGAVEVEACRRVRRQGRQIVDGDGRVRGPGVCQL